MAKKQTLKSADVSNISFIFHDKIISETQNYMKKLAQKQVKFCFFKVNILIVDVSIIKNHWLIVAP